MSEKPLFRVEEHLEAAKKAIEEKDLIGFVENISLAVAFAENDQDSMAKVTFTRVDGLVKFNQYKKALECIPDALKYNTQADNAFYLSGYRSVIFGYLGEFERSKKILLQVLEQERGIEKTMEVYATLAWVDLLSYRTHKKSDNLVSAKEYLDLAKAHFATLSNNLKLKVNNNYSSYYFYQHDYDAAVNILEETIQYCEEKDLPWIYTNLADIYLNFEGIDVSEIIKDYTEKAEVIANKYNDNFSIGRAFYIQAQSQLKANDIFRSLDTFYMAFEYFKKAEKYSSAFDCLIKMNEVIADHKVDRLKSLKDSLKNDLKDTKFYENL